ncbi:Apulose-4-phosphate transketolase subunit A [Streptomyces sp. enrichment culture]|uniref:transketolase n=1 Tax=Streptomyces sp. enrichment culture TaxID=1795815 RepID=UPI003F54BD18
MNAGTDRSTAAKDRTAADTAYRVRERVLRMGASEHGAHIGGSLSCTDVLVHLYTEVLRLRPDEPDWPDRDRFVLSKGHAAPALYAVLAETGFLDPAELETYTRRGSRLAGHPLGRLPGVEFPTGSLGHGLSLGTGVALAMRRLGRDSRAYVLLGDGELQEGSVWEAAMLAAQYRLGNLVAVVDRNGLQITGGTEDCVALEPLAERWRSFGWHAVEVDGHDHTALRAVFAAPPAADGRPTVVVARTVKGRGVALFEGKKKSHSVQLTPRLYQRARAGLRAGRQP